MKDLFEPDYYHHQMSPSALLSPSSSSSVQNQSKKPSGNGSTVLGRFLKLGKSKSDVNSHGGHGLLKGRKNGGGDIDAEDEFRLTISSSAHNLRGAERMVHKANLRKDNVSRSHSWIFGSLKVPSENVPFGYNGYGPPSPAQSNYAAPVFHHSPSYQQLHHYPQGAPTHSASYGSLEYCSLGIGAPHQMHHHQNGLHPPMQIPRCQPMMNNYCSNCEFSNDQLDPDHFINNPGLLAAASSAREFCQACNAHPPPAANNPKFLKNRKQQQSDSSESKTFASSVRKLTWKSLKQAVKKRPSIESLKTPPSPTLLSSADPNWSSAVAASLSSGNFVDASSNGVGPYFSQDDLLNVTTTNYFFPEKKYQKSGGAPNNYYASCTDLFTGVSHNGPNNASDLSPQHVTASVRVRPKRSRQTWHFPNEFGPTPNYQQGDTYHSEWDLRNYVPYEQWLTVNNSKLKNSNNANPQDVSSSETLTESVVAAITAANTLSSIGEPFDVTLVHKNNNDSAKGMSKISRPALSPNSNNNTTTTIIANTNNNTNGNNRGVIVVGNNSSSSSSSLSPGISSTSDIYSNGGVKRFSILTNELNAYQLNKRISSADNNSRNSQEDEVVNEIERMLSDDEDERREHESRVRIAGQGITITNNNSRISRSNSSSSKKAGKGNHPHHLVITSSSELPPHHESAKTSNFSTFTGHYAKSNTAPNNSSIINIGSSSSITGTRISADENMSNTINNGINGISNNNNSSNYTIEYDKYYSSCSKESSNSTSSPSTSKVSTNNMSSSNNNVKPRPIVKSQKCEQRENGIGTTTVEVLGNSMETSQSQSQANNVKNPQVNSSSSDSSSANNIVKNKTSNSNPKYGALRRRKQRNGKHSSKNLLRETIYEEEDSSDEKTSTNTNNNANNSSSSSNNSDENGIYTVKIVVNSQNNSSIASPPDYAVADYSHVKPILKQNSHYASITNSIANNANQSANINSESYNNKNGIRQGHSNTKSANNNGKNVKFTSVRVAKRVQFNSEKVVIVCGRDDDQTASDDEGNEEDEKTTEEEEQEEDERQVEQNEIVNKPDHYYNNNIVDKKITTTSKGKGNYDDWDSPIHEHSEQNQQNRFATEREVENTVANQSQRRRGPAISRTEILASYKNLTPAPEQPDDDLDVGEGQKVVVGSQVEEFTNHKDKYNESYQLVTKKEQEELVVEYQNHEYDDEHEEDDEENSASASSAMNATAALDVIVQSNHVELDYCISSNNNNSNNTNTCSNSQFNSNSNNNEVNNLVAYEYITSSRFSSSNTSAPSSHHQIQNESKNNFNTAVVNSSASSHNIEFNDCSQHQFEEPTQQLQQQPYQKKYTKNKALAQNQNNSNSSNHVNKKCRIKASNSNNYSKKQDQGVVFVQDDNNVRINEEQDQNTAKLVAYNHHPENNDNSNSNDTSPSESSQRVVRTLPNSSISSSSRTTTTEEIETQASPNNLSNTSSSYDLPLKAEQIFNNKHQLNKGGRQTKILNPNSLLFNDTTRIRLNQARPSLDQTFQLTNFHHDTNQNSSAQNAFRRGGAIRPSHSFRTTAPALATHLRPKDPPPPPPPQALISLPLKRPQLPARPKSFPALISTKSSSNTNHYANGNNSSSNSTTTSPYRTPTTKAQISLPMPMLGFSTTNNNMNTMKMQPTTNNLMNESQLPQQTNSPKIIKSTQNKMVKKSANSNSSLADKCEAVEKVLSSKLGTHSNSSNRSTSSPAQGKRNDMKMKSSKIAAESANSTIAPSSGNDKPELSLTPNELLRVKSNLISSHNRNQNQKEQNVEEKVEIRSKENSVNRIRISSGNSGKAESPTIDNSGGGANNSIRSNNSKSRNKEEMHYASTDLFDQHGTFKHDSLKLENEINYQKHNNNNNTLQSSSVRPQSTLFVHISEAEKCQMNIKKNHNNNNNNLSQNLVSSGCCSENIDLISSTSITKPSQVPPPLPPQKLNGSLMNGNTRIEDKVVGQSDKSCNKSMGEQQKQHHVGASRPVNMQQKVNNVNQDTCSKMNEQVDDEDDDVENEPVYDDVINHSTHSNNNNNKVQPCAQPNLFITTQSTKNSKALLASEFSPPNGPPPPIPPHSDAFNAKFLSSSSSSGNNNNGKPSSVNYGNDSVDDDGEIIYDDTDVIFATITSNSNNSCAKRENAPNGVISEETHEHYADDAEHLLYDDALSARTKVTPDSNYNPSKLMESGVKNETSNSITSNKPETASLHSEPLYDDVQNAKSGNKNRNSKFKEPDVEAETSSPSPPPLPSSGPPIHLLPKISLELPVILSSTIAPVIKSSTPDSTLPKPNGVLPKQVVPSLNSPHHKNMLEVDKSHKNECDEDLLDKTRSLLNELNDKLTKCGLSSPSSSAMHTDYSTYLNKMVHLESSPNANKVNSGSSSSESSSGVEEDYNSEKNYSLSLSPDDCSTLTPNSSASSPSTSMHDDVAYKLNQVSKLVNETMVMARGKFLDSMKTHNERANGGTANNNMSSNKNNARSPAVIPIEEPIYEEINECTQQQEFAHRPNSPIYADAFDAKSIFDGASRNEILSFLESIRDRLTAVESSSTNSLESRKSKSSSGSTLGGSTKSKKVKDIERNDSGIGSEAGSLIALLNAAAASSNNISSTNGNQTTLNLCKDCHSLATPAVTGEESLSANLCNSCSRKRNERKEIIQEIYETEIKYGRDLRIISDEFYNPIQIAGLLTKEQLELIFLNVGHLIEINVELTQLLKTHIEYSISVHDEDLMNVSIGKIFLEIGEKMMSEFESYCTRQANAGALLTQLEKEKELLRIFLRVSQMENAVLRRMNLPAFLMVPVQRVTRYPLLLSRLLKVTSVDHSSHDELQLAAEKIEQHLEHMNNTTREVASVKLWRRISIINGGNNSPIHRRSSSSSTNSDSNIMENGANARIRKMAFDVMNWSTQPDACCVAQSQLSTVNMNGKSFRNIYGCLLARGKNLERLLHRMDQDIFFPPNKSSVVAGSGKLQQQQEEIDVKDVKLILVRVKNTRLSLFREPLCLANCIISQGENEFQDFVEVNEISSKNTYYFQGMDKNGTTEWLKLLQCHAVCVGHWRKRRGALANIMMNGMIRHL